MKKNFKYIAIGLLILSTTVYSAVGKLQNADFATSAQITGAGGTVAQLLNSSKMYNSVDAEIMDTSIARWNAKLTSTLANGSIFIGSAGNVATAQTMSGGATISNTGVVTLTNASVTGQPITGYVSGAGVVSATDSILQAIQKLDGNTAAISGSAITSLTGDVTASGPGAAAATIANSAVTNAKMANMANNTIKSNISGGAAAPSDNTMSAILDATIASTQGDILYRNAANWVALPPGTAGQLLQTGGAAANPSWTPAPTGTVTSVAATVPGFLSVAGSPITTSGTLAITLATETANTVFAGPTSGGAATPTFRALVAADLPAPATSALAANDIDWSLLKNIDGLYTKTLSANTTLTFSNVSAGQTMVIAITNTASNYTVTWPAAAKWPGGSAPVETVGAKTDVITCKSYDGTNAYCSSIQNY